MKGLQLLFAVFACLVTLTVANKPYRPWLPRKCRLKYSERHECGYKGIPPDVCRAKGCCYDEVPIEEGKVPWCFKATTDKFISNKLLTVLAAEGVDADLILALYADANPGTEWLLAFRNGGMNTGHILKLIAGDLNIDPFYLKVLSGEDPIKLLLEKIAKQSGLKEEYIEFFADGNTEVILKHILYLLSARNGNPSIPYSVLSDVLSGKKLDSKKLLEGYVEQLLPKGDKFTSEFYKALYSGNRDEAIQWAYLSAFRYKFPQSGLYPQNTGLFMSLVMTQKNFPGKISPSIILALAKGEILPGINSDGQTFKQLFGVKAKDYICAAHDPTLQTACGPLKGRLYTTSKECEDAGCCLQQASDGRSAMCFDNVLGTIGTFLAQNVIDEHYINETILEGNLPNIEDFIPWLPNNELPSRYLNWYGDGTRIETFPDPYPTAMSLGPNKFRKDFKWKPHGPTSIPFNQKLPYEMLVPTIEPGVLNPYPGEEEAEETPIITQLTLKGFNSECLAVQPKDRIECIPNSVSLKDGGSSCVDNDCCYDPNWSDLNTPACFRLVSYGQCYKVAYGEREDCGGEGIKRDECLKNPQCCYDTALPVEEFFKGTPWCYYKKRSPILPKDVCIRAAERKPCLSSLTLNGLVNEQNCKSLGCCYEKVRVSMFDQVIGYSEPSPTCYKPAEYDLTPTEEPDEDTGATEERCQYGDEMDPLNRVKCGDATSIFECKVRGCCYEPIYFDPRFPWCFQKSVVSI